LYEDAHGDDTFYEGCVTRMKLCADDSEMIGMARRSGQRTVIELDSVIEVSYTEFSYAHGLTGQKKENEWKRRVLKK
jgi:hypothetical protein